LAGQSGGDDNDVAVFRFFVTVRTDKLYIKAVDRRGLCEIETFALRRSLDNVNQNHVRQFLSGDPMSSRRTDISRADNRNLISSSHYFPLLSPVANSFPNQHNYSMTHRTFRPISA